jgi:kynurenine formamidase
MAMPTYEELKRRNDVPAGTSWGLLGDLGTIGRLTPAIKKAAVQTVQTGETFNLDWPINAFDPPPSPTRHLAAHYIFQRNPNHRDDYLDSFYLQSTTQIDGLRHHRHAEAGFYNFAKDEEIQAGSGPIGIEQWADFGIVGRGVLIDVERYLAHSRGRGLDHRAGEAFSAEILDQALTWQQIELREADILLIRTGWAGFYFRELIQEQRQALPGDNHSPGLEQSEKSLAWLWDSRAAMVASDNIGVEALPVVEDSPFLSIDPTGMMHQSMIALLGLALGELWRLEELADACDVDSRYEMLVICKPLSLTGGVGSPANAMAIR